MNDMNLTLLQSLSPEAQVAMIEADKLTTMTAIVPMIIMMIALAFFIFKD